MKIDPIFAVFTLKVFVLGWIIYEENIGGCFCGLIIDFEDGNVNEFSPHLTASQSKWWYCLY
jgi:hypothetical protein